MPPASFTASSAVSNHVSKPAGHRESADQLVGHRLAGASLMLVYCVGSTDYLRWLAGIGDTESGKIISAHDSHVDERITSVMQSRACEQSLVGREVVRQRLHVQPRRDVDALRRTPDRFAALPRCARDELCPAAQ